MLEGKLDNLIDFANNDELYKIDPLIKMVIAHYQLEAIHTFTDVNGRTGRIFNIHYLTHKELLDLPILFLCRYIMDNKGDYYTRLMGIRPRGDWKTWLIYILKPVEVTANINYQKINNILSSTENILSYIKIKDKKIRPPEKLVHMLFKQPYTKVKHLIDGKVYSEVTVRDYLNKLSDIKVLEKKKYRRLPLLSESRIGYKFSQVNEIQFYFKWMIFNKKLNFEKNAIAYYYG